MKAARARGRLVPGRTRTVLVEAVDGGAEPRLPEKATPGAACFDLRSAESVELRPGVVTLVRTGLKVRTPKGTFLEVRPRSGLGAKGVLMANAPGTIDSDYAGEVRVPLTCLHSAGYRIEVGDRIAQVRLVAEVPTVFRKGRVVAVAGRAGGFGSTGR